MLNRAWRMSYVLFGLTVLVPTVLSSIYYGYIASDVFVSEARYVVRSSERQDSPSLGALLKGGVVGSPADAAYVVRDYILSREAMRVTDAELGLLSAYSDKRVDFLSRFPGLFEDFNLETFYEHYRRYVTVTVDPVSAVSVLSVRAYDAEFARRIGESLLVQSEALVNRINERMRRDALAQAQSELELAEARVREAEDALAKHRSLRKVMDPEKQAVLQLQRVDRLRDQLLAAELRLDQARALAPESPQVAAIEREISGLRAALKRAEAYVSGGEGSLANEAGRYQKLVIEREIAAKQLALAMDRLDRARIEADKKMVYIERVAGPSLADGSLEPRRLRNVLAIFLGGLLAFGVLSVVIAGVREHKEVV